MGFLFPALIRSSIVLYGLFALTKITIGSTVVLATPTKSSIVKAVPPLAILNKCVGVIANTVCPSLGLDLT